MVDNERIIRYQPETYKGPTRPEWLPGGLFVTIQLPLVKMSFLLSIPRVQEAGVIAAVAFGTDTAALATADG
jgi:hypothetical protein